MFCVENIFPHKTHKRSKLHYFKTDTQHGDTQSDQASTYVERPLQEDPAGLRLDVEVLEVVPLKRGGQTVLDCSIVVGVLVRGGNS